MDFCSLVRAMLSLVTIVLLCEVGMSHAEVRTVRQSPAIMCPRNFDPFMVGGKPKSCKSGDPAGCPKGFYCNQYFDTEADQQSFVCCGKAPGYCDGGVPYLDPITQEAKECQMGEKNVCPKDFNCRTRLTGSNDGFCCKDLDAVEPPPVGCPWGTREMKDSNSGIVLKCTPGKPNACPETGICYYDSVDNLNKCCAKDPGDGCPSGTKPQKSSANQSIACRPGVATQSCPGAGVCQWNYLVDRYQCCEADNGCPTGTVPLIEATIVRSCKKDLTGQCPTNFNCEYNFWANTYQCCGKDVGTCPSGQVMYITPTTGVAQVCPGGVGCQYGFSCQLSSTNQQVCCAPQGQCPLSYSLAADSNGRAVSCAPGLPNSCPLPASCQQAVNSVVQQYLCCKPSYTATAATCTSGAAPYILPGSSSPQVCQLNSYGQCPSPTNCESSTTPGMAICCMPTTTTNEPICPNSLLLNKVAGQIQYCTMANPTCAGGYNCLQAINIYGLYVCCGSAVVTYDPICPNDQQLARIGTQIQYCTPNGPNICPIGSNCNQATNFANQYVCCTAGGTVAQVLCPGNQQPNYVNGNYQFCNPQSPTCSTGFTCQQSSNQPSIYACCKAPMTTIYSCPAGGVVNYIGNQPQTCAVNIIGSCPSPYTCTQAANQPGVSICCQFTAASPLCPPAQSLLTVNGLVQFCAGLTAPCQTAGYTCQSSTAPGLYVCCGTVGYTSGTPACQSGMAVYSQGSVPFYCQPTLSQCPTGYQCQTSVESGKFVCCVQSGGVVNPGSVQCASRRSPLLLSSNVVPCVMNAPNCPYGYTCESAVGSGIQNLYICCASPETSVYTCPSGWQSDVSMGPIQTCQTNNPAFCSSRRSDYSCVESGNVRGVYVCCAPSTSVSQMRCYSGAQLYQSGVGQPLICDSRQPSSSQCPIGYSCQASTQPNTFVCCQTGMNPSVTQCADGSIAYLIGNQPQYCGLMAANCPSGYTCKPAAGSGPMICCSTGNVIAPVLKCPNGQTPYSTNGQIYQCANSCPVYGHSCVMAVGTSTFVCCPSSSPASITCQNGGQLLSEAFKCLSLTDCPAGYSCSSTSDGQTRCCGMGVNPSSSYTCLNGQTALMAGTAPRTCNIYQPDCPQGYICQQSSTGALVYYCCQGPVCPSGLTQFISNGQPQYCQPGGSTQPCPVGSSCQQATNVPGSFICCQGGSPPVSGAQCTGGRTTATVNGAPQYCTGSTSCGSNFECSAQTSTGQYLCCSRSFNPTQSVCPGGLEPFVDDKTGQFHFCSSTNYACPDGYICKGMIGSVSQFVCCKMKATCQRGWLPYLDPSTNEPKSCTPGGYDSGCTPPGMPYRCQQSTVPGKFLCCVESLVQWEIENSGNQLNATDHYGNSTDLIFASDSVVKIKSTTRRPTTKKPTGNTTIRSPPVSNSTKTSWLERIASKLRFF